MEKLNKSNNGQWSIVEETLEKGLWVGNPDKGGDTPPPQAAPMGGVGPLAMSEKLTTSANGQWSLDKSNYGPKGAGLYDPTVNIKRKETRTSEVVPDAGKNIGVRSYTTSGSSLQAAHEANQQKEQRVKEKQSVKIFTEEEKRALEAKMKSDPAIKMEDLSKPPVSEAQRRAMWAAASGKSKLDIPQSVGQEFAAADEGGKLPDRRTSVKKSEDFIAPSGQWVTPPPLADSVILKKGADVVQEALTTGKLPVIREGAKQPTKAEFEAAILAMYPYLAKTESEWAADEQKWNNFFQNWYNEAMQPVEKSHKEDWGVRGPIDQKDESQLSEEEQRIRKIPVEGQED